jgi:hyperosmotically inducible periplasmic protein
MTTNRLLIAAMFTGLSLSAFAQTPVDERPLRSDEKIQTQVAAELARKSGFKAVQTEVDDGIVTLSGNVDLYIDKLNAEKRVRKVKDVDGVRNHIAVEGLAVADNDLREKLASKLRYDRIGYGIVFNSLSLSVDRGTVTVSGNVRDYPDRDSAMAIVQTTAGVKNVIDEVEVAPLSGLDDGLRLRLAHAIYGHSALQKYALDPQAPIRIVVENGHVYLAGVVLSDLDKQVAYMQAQAVPGVFSVTNRLMVANN